MHQLDWSRDGLHQAAGETVIITGSARGIGAATATLFNHHGANVVIVDLPHLEQAANDLIQSMRYPAQALYVPASITNWKEMVHVFKTTITHFGRVDIVVANAGTMESRPVLDVEVDEDGDPTESKEATTVLDVNLKGTFNTLRLALHYMSSNEISRSGYRGSIVLLASTSGYFGSTGNAAYIASKHGVVGLLRASTPRAASLNVRLNAIAPGFTPTHITAGFGDSPIKAGLDVNTPESVAIAIALATLDEKRHGTAALVLGKYQRELEATQRGLMREWLGGDLADSLTRFGEVISDIGGYPLPQRETGAEL